MGNLTFHDGTKLMNSWKLEVTGKVLHRRGGQSSRRNQVWISRRYRIGSRHRNLPLGHICSEPGVDKPVIDCGVDHATKIDSIATANRSLAVTFDVVSKTESRAPIVLVAHLVAGLRQEWIDANWIW